MLDAVRVARDMYFDSVARVDVAKWARGRIALLGDASSCVSLFADGSTLAIAGAYELAQALTESPADPQGAFSRYQAVHGKLVASKQKNLVATASRIVPRTSTGVWLSTRAFWRTSGNGGNNGGDASATPGANGGGGGSYNQVNPGAIASGTGTGGTPGDSAANAGTFGGGGGGGGAGGGGVLSSGGIFTISGATTVRGGIGGGGGNGGDGAGGFGGSAGFGGGGGSGIDFTGAALLINNGSIIGGNGGAGGTGGAGLSINGANGAVGAGGAGVTGSNLSIINTGTISGGLAGDCATRANAITFTGGTNEITFGNATSGLTGNVDITGTLTLSGTNLYTGGTAINGGTIAVTDDSNLGNAAGGITFNGGTLQTSTPVGVPTFVSNRAITLLAGGGTIETDRATILGGNISGTGGLTKTGIQLLSLTGTNTYLGATNILSGQLQADAVGGLSASSAFTVAAGATLELRGSRRCRARASSSTARRTQPTPPSPPPRLK